MQFYQSCLGGELHFQTVGDTPRSASLPRKVKDYILHATLRKKGVTLMGTDMVEDEGLYPGNTLSVLILCNSEADLKQIYRKLATNGKATQPISQRNSGGLFGGLTDQYGIRWLLCFEENSGHANMPKMDWWSFQEN
jgi:PhnB protein